MNCRCRPGPRAILQDSYTREHWTVTPVKGPVRKSRLVLRSTPVCERCGLEPAAHTLASVGLKHLQPQPISGFGTQFHRSYKRDPSIYHTFSLAEDREGVILRRLTGLCKASTVVLDVGSGTGKYASLLGSYVRRYWALEPSPRFLAYSAVINQGVETVEHLAAGAEHIPLPDKSVDLVIMTWSTFAVSDAFAEMYRVLKSGGTMV